MYIGNVNCKELTEGSPIFALRRDKLTAKRIFTCDWEDASDLAIELRGLTTIDGSSFSRQIPHQFYWQSIVRPFTCVDVVEAKGAGVPRTNAGVIDVSRGVTSTTSVTDIDDVGFSDRCHLVAEYEIAPYAVVPDDDIDDPITPTGFTAFTEWDRFTEWNIDFSTELISVPYGAYKWATGGGAPGQMSQPLRIPISSARISAKVYNLPMIPKAAMYFQGAVNRDAFTFYLQPIDGTATQTFTCDAETLLFLQPKTEPKNGPDGNRYYDVTYYFSYRSLKGSGGTTYGHNSAPYYSSFNNTVTFERIAANPADTPRSKADNSAPFRLRDWGYLWSPSTPPVTP